MSSACPLCHTIRGTDAGGIIGPGSDARGRAAMSLAAGALPNGKGNLAAWIGDPQGSSPATTCRG